MKCWQCEGYNDKKCNEPFDGSKYDEKTSYLDCGPLLNEQSRCLKLTCNALYDLDQCETMKNSIQIIKFSFSPFYFLPCIQLFPKNSAGNLVFRTCAQSKKEYEGICGAINNGTRAIKDSIARFFNSLNLNNLKADEKIKEVCEMCDSDGCNSASQYGPVAMMIAIPVIIMRITSL